VEAKLMVQVLKDEIRERIYEAALDVFFQKDFKIATMQEIADKASVPAGLIYSYFKNKEALFDEIVRPVILEFPEILKKAEETPGNPFDKFISVEKEFFLGLFDRRREFVVLMDRSAGTSHSGAKENVIQLLEEHIKVSLKKKSGIEYEELFIHILASNFIESLLEIMRHYKSREWAVKMLDLMARHFYFGSNLL
jgi:AcrR family transcriptional regulator